MQNRDGNVHSNFALCLHSFVCWIKLISVDNCRSSSSRTAVSNFRQIRTYSCPLRKDSEGSQSAKHRAKMQKLWNDALMRKLAIIGKACSANTQIVRTRSARTTKESVANRKEETKIASWREEKNSLARVLHFSACRDAYTLWMRNGSRSACSRIAWHKHTHRRDRERSEVSKIIYWLWKSEPMHKPITDNDYKCSVYTR